MTASELIPGGLRDVVTRHVPDPGMPSGAAWLETLPRLVRELLEQWSLAPDGAPRHGSSALVLPVVRDDGVRAALKVVWPHGEGRDEHLALRAWAGRGAVRLLGAEPSRWALLLERLDAERDLRTVGVLDACEEVGRLLRGLDRPAPPWAPRLSDHLARFVEDADRLRTRDAHGDLFPRRLLERARSLATDLAAELTVDARLVHADLHEENVLWRPDPGEWVAIDPEPMAADRAFAVAPTLWNRWEEAQSAYNLRTHVNLRLDVLCDAADVDPDRARAFSLVRVVRNVLWDLEAPHAGTAEDVTRHVTLAKALQGG